MTKFDVKFIIALLCVLCAFQAESLFASYCMSIAAVAQMALAANALFEDRSNVDSDQRTS